MRGPTEIRPIVEAPNVGGEECAFRLLTVREAVRSVKERRWDIPDFQREFIWSPLQVRDLADSLWRGYPMGLLLLWHPPGHERSPLMVVDGQHRLTALCMLLGQMPAWWSGDRQEAWHKLLPSYDVRFDTEACKPPFFKLMRPGRDQERLSAALPVSLLLSLDPHSPAGRRELDRIAAEVSGQIPSLCPEDVYARLERVCRIADRPLVASVAERPVGDVLEIFARLSGHGIRFRRLLLRTALQAMKAMWVSQSIGR